MKGSVGALPFILKPSPADDLDEHLVRRTALALPPLSEVSTQSGGDALYHSAGVLYGSGYRVGHLFRRVFHRIHCPRHHLIEADDLQAGAIEDVIHRAFHAPQSRMRSCRDGGGVVENQL